jgi:hypothetical protein
VVPSLPDGLLPLPAAGEAADVPGAIKCDDGLAALGAGPYPALMRNTALRTPGRLRPRFAPAFAIVAERSRSGAT